MKGNYQYIILHISLFFGALIFQNVGTFLVLSALAGYFPRQRNSFGYFLLTAVLGFAITFALNPPHAELNERLSGVMGISPLPFWVPVMVISTLTMALTAKAVNSLLAKKEKRQLQRHS